MQAVYAAFARFRARHRVGSGRQTAESSPSTAEAESAAINMLQHVTATAAEPTPFGGQDPQQASPSGIRSIPSQQSDLHSMTTPAAEQGSADR